MLRQTQANCFLTMTTEQVSEWNFFAGIEGANDNITYAADYCAEDGIVGMDLNVSAILNQAYVSDIASIGSAKHFSGGCHPCCSFLKGLCFHGSACQNCHMSHNTEARKRNGPRHRRSELLSYEDKSCQLGERKRYDMQHAGQPPMSSPHVILDPLALLTEPLKVPISENMASSGSPDGMPTPFFHSDKLLPDGTCLARALRSDVNLPIQVSTLPNSSHAQLLGPFRHSSTNPVEPLGLQKTSQAVFESGYINHLEALRSQCARDVQECYIHELETQNAFLRSYLMQCFQMASASV